MKLFLAAVVCRLLRFIGKLVGKGSSLPGKYALKICPDVLGRVALPPCVIAVTGSNGKTSTVEMIAAILRAGGKTVVYNEEGSNQIEGVTTLILCNSTLGGRMKADVLLLESPPVLPVVPPHPLRHHQPLPGPADPERPPGVGLRRHPPRHPSGYHAGTERGRSPGVLLCAGP